MFTGTGIYDTSSHSHSWYNDRPGLENNIYTRSQTPERRRAYLMCGSRFVPVDMRWDENVTEPFGHLGPLLLQRTSFPFSLFDTNHDLFDMLFCVISRTSKSNMQSLGDRPQQSLFEVASTLCSTDRRHSPGLTKINIMIFIVGYDSSIITSSVSSPLAFFTGGSSRVSVPRWSSAIRVRIFPSALALRFPAALVAAGESDALRTIGL